MEKITRICVLFLMTILCGNIYSLVSYAQPDSECPHGTHEYVSQILIPASEEEPGQVQNTCIYCGDVSIEYLPETGHAYGPWEAAQEQKDGERLERRICSRCGRSEERWLPITADDTEDGTELQSDGAKTVWRVNGMDYVLTAATGGVWGYAAIVLWWNSLVLIWYKKECSRKKEKRHDVE